MSACADRSSRTPGDVHGGGLRAVEAPRSLRGFPQLLRRVYSFRRRPPPPPLEGHPPAVANEFAATTSRCPPARTAPAARRVMCTEAVFEQLKPRAVCGAFRSCCGEFTRSGAGLRPPPLKATPQPWRMNSRLRLRDVRLRGP